MKLTKSFSSNFYKRELNAADTATTFKNFGFDAMELGTTHGLELYKKNGWKDFKKHIDSIGFTVPQGHITAGGDITTTEAIERDKRWLDGFLEIGVKAAVIHAKGALDESEDVRFEKLANSMRILSEYLKGTDTVLCIENCMRRLTYDADMVNAIIDAAGANSNLGICLDTGHLNFCYVVDGDPYPKQSQYDFIIKAGKRLKALHINNNDSYDDDHLFPFTVIENGIDFKDVMRGLDEVGYNGLFNFEVPGEAIAPKVVLDKKVELAKIIADYMMNEEYYKL